MAILSNLFQILLLFLSFIMIVLILLQRGRGGGLAGAFGGMGGQSAFGTKAGDVFTRVTIITALVWIFFCMLAIKLISKEGPRRSADNLAPASATAPLTPGEPAKGTSPAATTPSDTKTGDSAKDDKGTAPAATTPDSSAPAATPATPMTPATTTPAESSTPAPATPEGK